MKTQLLCASAISLALSSFSTFANEAPNYDHVGAGYAIVSFDDNDIDLDPTGYGVHASKQLGENFFVKGRYLSTSDDIKPYGYKIDFDLDFYNLDAGYIYSISEKTDVNFTLGYMKMEIDADGEDEDTDVLTASVGMTSRVASKVQLNAHVGYGDGDDVDGVFLNAGASYDFTEKFSVAADVYVDEDIAIYYLNGRYNF